jgi:hypothetical protein
MLKIKAALILMFFGSLSSATTIDPKILNGEYSVLGGTGKVQLSRLQDRKAIVVIAQGVSCPVMRQNYPGFLALEKEFKSKRVEFLFVNANPQDSKDDIATEAKGFGLENRIILDSTQDLIRALGLTTIGEAAVVLPGPKEDTWNVVYRGGLSDRVNFDRSLPKAAHEYLREALQDVTTDHAVRRAKVPIFGCTITFNQKP